MTQRTPLWVWLIIGLIGLGLIASARLDIFAPKARQAALELRGTIAN